MDALRLLARNNSLPLDCFSSAGLKDRQAVTTQLIAVKGKNLTPIMQDSKEAVRSGLHIQYMGRMDHPLSGKDVIGNRFTITVRKVPFYQATAFEDECVKVSRTGMINYFDSQRFGCLRNGEGFSMRYILRGEHEKAFRMIVCSLQGEGEHDSHVRGMIRDNWGNWQYLSKALHRHNYRRCFSHLAKHPYDFKGALGLLPEFERTLPLFAYQSYLWNSAVVNFLKKAVPSDSFFHVDYVAGKLLLFDGSSALLAEQFKDMKFPLIGNTLDSISDPAHREAYVEVLDAEDISLSQLKVKTHGFYLKEEQRPLVVFPENVSVLEICSDELVKCNGMMKVTVSFDLPRGSYATLVMRCILEGVATSQLEMRVVCKENS